MSDNTRPNSVFQRRPLADLSDGAKALMARLTGQPGSPKTGTVDLADLGWFTGQPGGTDLGDLLDLADLSDELIALMARLTGRPRIGMIHQRALRAKNAIELARNGNVFLVNGESKNGDPVLFLAPATEEGLG